MEVRYSLCIAVRMRLKITVFSSKELLSLVPLKVPGNHGGGEAPELNDPAKSSVSRVLAA